MTRSSWSTMRAAAGRRLGPAVAALAMLVLAACSTVGENGASDDPQRRPAPTPSVLGQVAPRPVTPSTAPSGLPYERCVADLGAIDWHGDAERIVETYERATQQPCAETSWYEETSMQNGVLAFMVLIGEYVGQPGPRTDDPELVASLLRDQGYDRVAAIEVASSGWCQEGEIQAAYLHLHVRPDDDGATDLFGLTGMVESARLTEATVERGEDLTLFHGGGAPCATAILHRDDLIGWITGIDPAAVRRAVADLTLP